MREVDLCWALQAEPIDALRGRAILLLWLWLIKSVLRDHHESSSKGGFLAPDRGDSFGLHPAPLRCGTELLSSYLWNHLDSFYFNDWLDDFEAEFFYRIAVMEIGLRGRNSVMSWRTHCVCALHLSIIDWRLDGNHAFDDNTLPFKDNSINQQLK